MTIPELRAALEKRRDEKAMTHMDFEKGIDPRSDFYSFKQGQDDLIPVIVKLTEALELSKEADAGNKHYSEFEEVREQALEELEAWVSPSTTTKEDE